MNFLDLISGFGIVANSTEYGNTQATPRVQNDARTWHGRVRAQYSTYTFASAAAGSVISMCNIPKDSRILDIQYKNAALGSSVTVAIGDSSDADRLLPATASSSAGITRITAAAAGFAYVTTADTVITATTAGATATGQIELVVYYMID